MNKAATLAIAIGLTVSPGWGQAGDAVHPDWLSTVKAEIEDSEYHVTWQEATYLAEVEAAWQAPNRAQNLRTYFLPRGIRVVPRTEARPSWELRMSLARWGRPQALQPIEPATELRADDNRIELYRGPIVEWYVNDQTGLEQGFTVLEPPRDGPGALVLDLAVEGGLAMRIAADGQAVEFVRPGNRLAVRYAKLAVFDAGGAGLPARIEGVSSGGVRGLRLAIDDRGAVYPVEIDPLMNTHAWFTEPNQAGAFFGWDVATAGDVNGDGYSDVVVGAYGYDNGQTDEGSAWVYHGSASGPSTTAGWSGEGDQGTAHYGYAVGTAGDVNGDGYSDLIVGARLYDQGQTDEGKVFVYHGSASGLSATADWEVDSNTSGATFGVSVGTAGDVDGDGYSDVIIGGDRYDNGQADEGRAWLYNGSSTGLDLTASWSVESGQAGALFGGTVGTAGDVNGDGYADVVVAAHQWDQGQTNEGKVWVYHGSATGVDTTADWEAQGDQASASFGASAGTAGDVNGDGYADVVIGATLYGNASFADAGRVFVYHGSATGLAATAAWTADGDQNLSSFGQSVGTAGDVNGDGYADVVVGAFGYTNGFGKLGRVYVYHGSTNGPSGATVWTQDGPQPDARFGESVGTAGDVNGDGFSDLIVGARRYDNGQADEGRAYVYHGGGDGLSAVDDWTGEGDQVDAHFGDSVAAAGDVNGDGYADVIVGAEGYDNGEINEGRAFVYHGSATGPSATADWTAESDQSGAQYGVAVSTAGDVNGDGYADVIVGARNYENGEDDEGRAFVYHGSPTGLSAAANWTAESDQVNARMGSSVSTAGDVNGDGYADVIVGATGYSNGESSEGRAFVYLGSASGLSLLADWTAESDLTNAEMGSSVAAAGDVNGDGYGDVVIGARGYFNGESGEGGAYVYHGSVSGPSTVADWTAEGDQASAVFGRSVATAGDVNGDGYADVIIGANGYTNGEAGEGRAYVYHGSASGLSATADWITESNQANANYGWSVGTAGDVNGDGYADVIIGAWSFDNGQATEGHAFIYHGSPSGLGEVKEWTGEGNHAGAQFGGSVGTAGDVNGDGYADVIVGARNYDNGEQDEGRAFVYMSRTAGEPARGVRPGALRVGSSVPITHLTASDALDAFRIELTGFTPFGRGDVALQYEVKPFGTAFDGTGTTTTDFVDAGLAGATFTETVSSLSEETLYHWRARVRYAPATSPFQPHGPWFTIPRNGWQEADLRTGATAGAGSIDADDAGSQVQVEVTAEGNVRLSWGKSCIATDEDYAIYHGEIGDFTGYVPETCSTGGALSYEYPPDPVKSSFYLVVPLDIQSASEGSYGLDGAGQDRPPSTSACHPQVIEAACP